MTAEVGFEMGAVTPETGRDGNRDGFRAVTPAVTHSLGHHKTAGHTVTPAVTHRLRTYHRHGFPLSLEEGKRDGRRSAA